MTRVGVNGFVGLCVSHTMTRVGVMALQAPVSVIQRQRLVYRNGSLGLYVSHTMTKVGVMAL